MNNSNNIPLVDVTEGETLEQMLAKAVPEAIEKIQNAEQFALVVINKPDGNGNQSVDASVGASDHALLSMVVTLLGIIGAGHMGDKLMNMPSEIARATAQMMGFQVLNGFLQQQAQRALAAAEPQTPATDAGKPTVN